MAQNGDRQPGDRIDEKLDELARFETHAAFGQLFCRLLTTWCREAGDESLPLQHALGSFLDGEIWYHEGLETLAERDIVLPGDLRSLADRRRIKLTAVTERIQSLDVHTPRAKVVWHLLLAECHYHLRETRSVVAELEAAIEGGGGHPLVHFALGYNRLDQARERYSTTQVKSNEEAVALEEEFHTACMEAVGAFRDGLTGQAFDAWLHLYIGRALAAAGRVDEASAALETAARIDSSIFGQPAILDDLAVEMPDASLHMPRPPSPPGEEPAGKPISDDEVAEFADLLRGGSWRPEDLID